MATALPVLPTRLAADESAGLLAHVPFANVRREVQLSRLAFPAPQVDIALAARQLPCLAIAGLGTTSRR